MQAKQQDTLVTSQTTQLHNAVSGSAV